MSKLFFEYLYVGETVTVIEILKILYKLSSEVLPYSWFPVRWSGFDSRCENSFISYSHNKYNINVFFNWLFFCGDIKGDVIHRADMFAVAFPSKTNMQRETEVRFKVLFRSCALSMIQLVLSVLRIITRNRCKPCFGKTYPFINIITGNNSNGLGHLVYNQSCDRQD